MSRMILYKMEKTRELMIKSGIENGLQNVKTIRLSRKLDELLNLYDKEKQDQEDGDSIFYKFYNH